jgi:hypothetical protein
LFFRTVPTANTLVRWVNENAFAVIVQARPCPTFGRPVHRRGSPHRLRPGTSPHTLRIPPHDGTPCPPENCGEWLQVHLGCIKLSHSCPFRLLHTFSPLRPARHYPRFWIQRPSSGRRRDFNPPEQCAAQRTLWPLLTSRCQPRGRRPFRRNARSPQVRTRSFTAQPPDLRNFISTTMASQ